MVEHTNNSREVISNQQGTHENLEIIVRKHFESEYKKPIAKHTQYAFDQIKSRVESELKKDTPVLFDSFCGTGISTGILAENNPQALVIGIDRSIARLSKTYNDELPSNAILVQADCYDFWFLAQCAGWKLSGHTLFYPNPYPKAKHVKRRIHGHPAYPLLYQLEGEIELRTNWKIYVDEFEQSIVYASDYLEGLKPHAESVETLGFDSSTDKNKLMKMPFMTLFEKKYFLNGQRLYRCKLGFIAFLLLNFNVKISKKERLL